MNRLLASELLRATRRPVTRLLVLAAMGAIVVAGLAVFLAHEDISGQELLDERTAVARDCVDDPPPRVEEASSAALRRACAIHARLEVEDPRYHLVDTDDVLKGATVGVVLIAWIIGASLIGGDWQSRSLTTLLTWEPRRVRVAAAKVLAIVIVIAALSVTGLALAGLAMLPAAALHGTTDGLDASWWSEVGLLLVRGTALGVMAAVVAFSIAAIGRSTAAAFGIGFAILLVENIAGGLLPEWRRFTLLGNSIVFVVGEDNSGEVLDRSFRASALILAVVAAVALATGVAVFRRQEVR